jgi:hypothetical protein
MNNLQLYILRQLATYKFLTLSQFRLCGLSVCSDTMYKHLSVLKEKWLSGKQSYAYAPKYGKVEDVHFLKPKWRDYLVKRSNLLKSEIKMPIGTVKRIVQYEHRKKTIDIHIQIKKSCHQHDINLDLYDSYFEGRSRPVKTWRESATKIRVWDSFIRPDSIFLISDHWVQNLFCLELHNGYRLKKIIEQLKPYAYALAQGTPSIKYNIHRSARVLVVFEKESTCKHAIEHLAQDSFYKYLKEYFLFITYDQLMVTPLSGRTTLNKKSVSLTAQKSQIKTT